MCASGAIHGLDVRMPQGRGRRGAQRAMSMTMASQTLLLRGPVAIACLFTDARSAVRRT